MSEKTTGGTEATTRELRIFGIAFGLAFGTMLGGVLPLLRHHRPFLWPWLTGTVFLLVGLLAPEALRRFRTAWLQAGHFVGGLQTKILLAIVFYTLVTPLGLVRRLARKTRRFEPQRSTYRLPSAARAFRSMERPF